MKILVDTKNYTCYEYTPYLNRGKEVKAPKDSKYIVGQVVVVERDNEEEFAVVLGCIDEEFDGELRLDLCGMTCFEYFRSAEIKDFTKDSKVKKDKIFREVNGFKVSKFGE